MLNSLNSRSVSTDALFEVLRLEALDWGLDNGVETEIIETAPAPVTADRH